MPAPESQSFYQVRFDWGLAGVEAIGAGADVVVWVDELGEPTAPEGATLVSIDTSERLAEWILEQQAAKGDRFRVAVVAAGAIRGDGTLRFAVEDLLGAGAVIAAIGARGIDHTSPEAAAAEAAYLGLRQATRHLFSGSVSGREHAQPDGAES